MKSEEESPFDEAKRWLVMALQIMAMALCACILANLYIEDTLKTPLPSCIESSATPPQ